MSDIIDYGGQSVNTLQITTGLYPTTETPIDIRETVARLSVLTSNEEIGCSLYPGLTIYVEDTNEYVSTVSKKPGTDGTRWQDWVFKSVILPFKSDIDHCHDVQFEGKYDSITEGDYTPQNLLNYLYLRGRDTSLVSHTLTVNYVYAVSGSMAHEPYVELVREGVVYSVPSPYIHGYTPDVQVVSGTMSIEDVTVTVTYSELPKYTVTVQISPSGSGTVTGAGEYYEGDDAVLTATPAAQYDFTRWKENSSVIGTSQTLTITDISSNHSLTARFTRRETNIILETETVPAGEIGGYTYGSGYVDTDAETSVSATANNGYRFTGWYSGSTLVSSDNVYIFTPSETGDMTLTAHFIKMVTVSFSPMTGGTATGGGQYDYGSNATLTATPSSGYVFRYWSVSGLNYELNPYTISNLTANVTATAVFEAIPVVKVLAWTDSSTVDLSGMTRQQLKTYLEQKAAIQGNYVEVLVTDTDGTYRKTFSHENPDTFTSADQYLVIAIPDNFSTGDGNVSGNAKFYTRGIWPTEHGYVAELPVIDSAQTTLDAGSSTLGYDLYEAYQIPDPAGTQVVFGNVVSGQTTTFDSVWNHATQMP